MGFSIKKSLFMLILILSVILLGATGPALAAHYGVSLENSNFEIEDPATIGANLVVDDPQLIDWAHADVQADPSLSIKSDMPTGSNDDAFGQGAKEDTAVPAVVSGSIPPNKSDLDKFGVYVEQGDNGDRFMHLFWTRAQDPKGTTNMDFEFNQNCADLSDPDCDVSPNGVTAVRLPGDMLIIYELTKGGSVPELFVSRWIDQGDPAVDCEASSSLPCWSTRQSATDTGIATGSINNAFIPAAESGGLGDLDPRTFGEASINLAFLFNPGECLAFGGAYLKSRSSDSFTSSLKDFIAPQGVDIRNCGQVIVRKRTDPMESAGTFNFTTTGGLIPAAFSLQE